MNVGRSAEQTAAPARPPRGPATAATTAISNAAARTRLLRPSVNRVLPSVSAVPPPWVVRRQAGRVLDRSGHPWTAPRCGIVSGVMDADGMEPRPEVINTFEQL